MTHPRKQALFVLLSLADLGLTCWLLERSGGRVYEANPLARWWLARHGLAGLACFKAAVVALVLGLSLLIARARPRAAGRVLALGCAASAAVVLYSAALCPAARVTAEEVAREQVRQHLAHLDEVNGEAKEEQRKHRALDALLAGLGRELAAGRCTLREAVRRVAASEKGRDPAWRRGLAVRYRGRPFEECVAACVMGRLVNARLDEPRGAWRLALWLEQQFRLTFGSPPPLGHRDDLPDAEAGDSPGGRYQTTPAL